MADVLVTVKKIEKNKWKYFLKSKVTIILLFSEAMRSSRAEPGQIHERNTSQPISTRPPPPSLHPELHFWPRFRKVSPFALDYSDNPAHTMLIHFKRFLWHSQQKVTGTKDQTKNYSFMSNRIKTSLRLFKYNFWFYKMCFF